MAEVGRCGRALVARRKGAAMVLRRFGGRCSFFFVVSSDGVAGGCRVLSMQARNLWNCGCQAVRRGRDGVKLRGRRDVLRPDAPGDNSLDIRNNIGRR